MKKIENNKYHQIELLSSNVCTGIGAGSKAPLDVSKIIINKYNFKERRINLYLSNNKLLTIIRKIIYILKKFIYLVFSSNKKYYIIQSNYFDYPFFLLTFYSKILKSKKIILFIHDINWLRELDFKKLKKEINLFNNANYIICHNKVMQKFLIEQGISKEKLYILECFDYLCNEKKEEEKETKNKEKNIIYAGNLDKFKSEFLYELEENKMNFNLNIYGKGIEKYINKKIKYKGTYSADDVINSITGDIGLVWDGKYNSDDENYYLKHYTKYNNPHKLSCYLAANLPVIVWRKSAIANFVKDNNIGYLIDNVYDINNLDFKDLDIKKKNVMEIGKKVRSGYYTLKVLEKILNEVKDEI